MIGSWVKPLWFVVLERTDYRSCSGPALFSILPPAETCRAFNELEDIRHVDNTVHYRVLSSHEVPFAPHLVPLMPWAEMEEHGWVGVQSVRIDAVSCPQ